MRILLIKEKLREDNEPIAVFHQEISDRIEEWVFSKGGSEEGIEV